MSPLDPRPREPCYPLRSPSCFPKLSIGEPNFAHEPCRLISRGANLECSLDENERARIDRLLFRAHANKNDAVDPITFRGTEWAGLDRCVGQNEEIRIHFQVRRHEPLDRDTLTGKLLSERRELIILVIELKHSNALGGRSSRAGKRKRCCCDEARSTCYHTDKLSRRP